MEKTDFSENELVKVKTGTKIVIELIGTPMQNNAEWLAEDINLHLAKLADGNGKGIAFKDFNTKAAKVIE